RATVDVLHGIIERLGSFGITTLPQFKKVKKRLVSG
ncbi:MAG: DNA polymerase III subunit epsilon, partial [Actinobacteria bacterium]|nr:DNA polymerase III subunit epsilon [Actinomycetota bacterium]